MAQGVINVIRGNLYNQVEILLEYDHGYAWANDADYVNTVQWSVLAGSPSGFSIREDGFEDGPLDNVQSGPRNPVAAFFPTGIGTYTVQCSALLVSGGIGYSYTQTVQLEITENVDIIQKQEIIYDELVGCAYAAIRLTGEDNAGSPVEFNKYQLNYDAVVDITSTSSFVVSKNRAGVVTITIWATDVGLGSSIITNTAIIPQFANDPTYTLTYLDVVITEPAAFQVDYGEGDGWDFNMLHTFATEGSKSVLVADQYGCIRTVTMTAVNAPFNDINDYKSTFYNSKANSLRLVELVEFDDCVNFKTDENTFGDEVDYKELNYCDVQMIKNCWDVKHQFKSGYDSHLVKIFNIEGVEISVPAITLVQQNLGYEDVRDYLYLEDTEYSFLYFDGCGTIPYFYEIGGVVTIGIEAQIIRDIVYLESIDKWALKTFKFVTYADSTVKYIYNRQIYNVYEFDLFDTLLPNDEYYIEITATRTTATDPEENKTINFKSLDFIVADNFDEGADIRYWNNRNNDLYWQSGYIGYLCLIVNSRVSIGETENTVVGTDDTSYLEESYGREKFTFVFEPQTLEMARKAVAALSQFNVTINGTRYAFDSVAMNTIGEQTNDYTITASGYKAAPLDYAIDSFGAYVQGFQAAETITIVHRECNTIINLVEREVEVVFDQPFPYDPQGVANLIAYRMVNQGGIWVRQDVVFSFPTEQWLTRAGFRINIATFESPGGAIIEYCFY